MPRLKIRRAWGIDEDLRRYFILSKMPPSATINLTGSHASPERPPKWLIFLCTIGCAIAKLAATEQEAVEGRWKAAVAQEQCELAEWMAQRRQVALARERKDTSHWVDEAIRARVDAEAHRKQRRQWEDRRAYQDGMSELTELLG